MLAFRCCCCWSGGHISLAGSVHCIRLKCDQTMPTLLVCCATPDLATTRLHTFPLTPQLSGTRTHQVEAVGHDRAGHEEQRRAGGAGGRQPAGVAHAGEAARWRAVLHHRHVLDGLRGGMAGRRQDHFRTQDAWGSNYTCDRHGHVHGATDQRKGWCACDRMQLDVSVHSR